jgi:hypothetical protein
VVNHRYIVLHMTVKKNIAFPNMMGSEIATF